MRLDHQDYTTLLLGEYKRKIANNEISPLLSKPTPAKIRRACVTVFQERYNRRDEQILKAFFGLPENSKSFLDHIRDFETDKFKPLDNYLKGHTERTDDKNLELLAWLIDFRHRPHIYGTNVLLNDDELAILGKSRKPVLSESKLEVRTAEVEEKSFGPDQEKIERLPTKEGEGVVIFDSGKKNSLIRSSHFFGWRRLTARIEGVYFLGIFIVLAGAFIFWQREKDENGISPDSNIIEIKDTASRDTSITYKIAPTLDRCLFITKKGTQCKRKAESNGLCWQHKK